MDAPTDEQLLAAYLDGDEAAFELLVRRHVRELHQFVVRFTTDAPAADDVVQETLLQVHAAADRFDPKRRFKPWLFTIAANKARDYLRRRSRRREVSIDAPTGFDQGAKQRFVELFEADSVAPDDDLLVEEKRRLVRRVIEGMPTKLSEVLILAYYHRFPYREVAEIVGVPLGTVKSRLHAAVASFGAQYKLAVAEHEREKSQS